VGDGLNSGTGQKPPARQDLYTIKGDQLRCGNCSEAPDIKSNAAIAEEVARVTAYLAPRRAAGCPNLKCANHDAPVEDRPDAYVSHGTSRSGSPRWKCKLCGRTFSIAPSTVRQRMPEKNILFFKLLHTRISLSKIMTVLEVTAPTVYAKIDFLHEQCMKFLSDREREMPTRDEIFLATDRQAYLTNWQQNRDARNIQFAGIGTADLASGYVLGMNVDYDPELDPLAVEAGAINAGDYGVAPPYRRCARVWLEGDFTETYKRAMARLFSKHVDIDPGELDTLAWDRKLPDAGMLVHQDYTMHGHFRLIGRLLKDTRRLNWYTEEETGMRPAMFAAFKDDIDDRLQAFHVRVVKGLSVNDRRAEVGRMNAEYRKWRQARREEGVIDKEETEYACRIRRIVEAIAAPEIITNKATNTHELWIRHPFPSLAEPVKRVKHLTGPDWTHPIHWAQDDGYPTDDDEPSVVRVPPPPGYKLRARPRLSYEELARLVDQASLHAIDVYFMQIRRDIGELERGISVAASGSRIWYGYSAYNPGMIQKLIDIHRLYCNYIQVSKIDGKTRAQRFGLAKGKIRHQDVIYYR
jgi:transposase-like protein